MSVDQHLWHQTIRFARQFFATVWFWDMDDRQDIVYHNNVFLHTLFVVRDSLMKNNKTTFFILTTCFICPPVTSTTSLLKKIIKRQIWFQVNTTWKHSDLCWSFRSNPLWIAVSDPHKIHSSSVASFPSIGFISEMVFGKRQ